MYKELWSNILILGNIKLCFIGKTYIYKDTDALHNYEKKLQIPIFIWIYLEYTYFSFVYAHVHYRYASSSNGNSTGLYLFFTVYIFLEFN